MHSQVNNLFQKQGSLVFDSCASSTDGGAMYVQGNATFLESVLRVKGCKAQTRGGGLFVVDSLRIQDSVVHLTHNYATQADGGMRVGRSFLLRTSELSAQACSTGGDGGGLSGPDGLSEFAAEDSNISFTSCTAQSGAGIQLKHSVVRLSACAVYFSHGWARYNGGGMELEHGNFSFQSLDPFSNMFFILPAFYECWQHRNRG